MTKRKSNETKSTVFRDGYQPKDKRGYRPTQGNLDNSKPPQGGSGVPSKPPAGNDTNKK